MEHIHEMMAFVGMLYEDLVAIRRYPHRFMLAAFQA